MSKTVFVYVNGIRTWPGSDKNWTGKAVTWTNKRSKEIRDLRGEETVVSEKVEYHCFALLRWLQHGKRVHRFRRTLDFYRNWNVCIAAHSNGATVVLDGLREAHWPSVETLDLLSPACSSQLGYITPRLGKEVKKLRIWQAQKDIPLRLARTLTGKLLGYGSLGIDAPRGIPLDVLDKHVEIITEPTFGHSTRFTEINFGATMRRIVGL